MVGGDEWSSTDLYALLNVDRHATREDIKAAYTLLARVLHPDKRARLGFRRDQVSPQVAAMEQKEAQELFILVDRAYKVLSNEMERKVYDAYGHEGLDALHSLDAEQRKMHLEGLEELYGGNSETQVGFLDERGTILREKLLGKVHLERELEAIGRFNIRGAVQVNVDAKGVLGNMFEPQSIYDIYDEELLGGLDFEAPSITGVVVQQSVDAALSETDSITLGAHVMTRGDMGGHNVSIHHAHKFSESTSSEVTLASSSRDPFSFTLQGNRTLSQNMKGSLEFVMREQGRTGMNVQAMRKLTDTVTGVLQLGFGIESGLVVQLNHSSLFGKARYTSKKEQEEFFNKNFFKPTEQGEVGSEEKGTEERREYEPSGKQNKSDLTSTYFSNGSLMFFLSGSGLGVHTSFARSFSQKSHGKVGAKLSTGNAEFEITSSRILSAHSKGNVTLSFGVSGVRLTIRYDRGGMRYVVPFSLTSGMSVGATVVGGCIPALVNYMFSRVMKPYYERRIARQEFTLAEKLIEARKKAKMQMEIMSKKAELNVKQAKEKYGLVVLRARYGYRLHEECDWRDVQAPSLEKLEKLEASRPRLPSDWDEPEDEEEEEEEAEEEVEEEIQDQQASTLQVYNSHPPNIDVTTQLNFFSKEDSLELHGGKSKAQLLGFYNPCLGKPCVQPELYIRYQLASWVYEITVDDIEPVRLPSHRATLIGN
eukprot:CAMPEP_0203758642 /NCGR_PEP_ID=MMETSP0098-20131031/11494_1 /ASSEMBLY_ACC=CAM_ASM_000208 /TAXON_ID=96639 /ORGANISM=" , Strain NY0313808BC1" /LENGTH=706 /DNA_ID=CAMNT_0050651183 /DNA_START=162 /DNA_END=2279 /DNA_ORIENTATION=+